MRRGEVLQWRAALHAGVVDQDVDRADLFFEVCYRVADAIGVGHIETARVDCCTCAAQRMGGTGEACLVAAVQDDGRAGQGETPGKRITDAGARTGDQRSAPAEVE